MFSRSRGWLKVSCGTHEWKKKNSGIKAPTTHHHTSPQVGGIFSPSQLFGDILIDQDAACTCWSSMLASQKRLVGMMIGWRTHECFSWVFVVVSSHSRSPHPSRRASNYRQTGAKFICTPLHIVLRPTYISCSYKTKKLDSIIQRRSPKLPPLTVWGNLSREKVSCFLLVSDTST
jgi:hypothetical protein